MNNEKITINWNIDGILLILLILFIILKVAAIILALIELSLFTDVTLEGRDESRTPTIQQIKSQGYSKNIVDGVTFYTKK